MIYLQGSDRRRDPPDMDRGVPGAHQGGRPGNALSVPVGWEGSLAERLLCIRGHATCLRIPVHVYARG